AVADPARPAPSAKRRPVDLPEPDGGRPRREAVPVTTYYIRNPDLVAYSIGDQLHLLRPEQPETMIGPADPAAVTLALAGLANPVDEAGLAELFEPTTAQLLIDRHVIVAGSLDELGAPATARSESTRCGHLLVGVSGSVAAIQAATMLLPLLFGFAEKVDVI